MTIYRINADRMNYQLLTISSEEVISKLGRQYPFHIDPTTKPYASVWKPLEVSFYDSTSGKKKPSFPISAFTMGVYF